MVVKLNCSTNSCPILCYCLSFISLSCSRTLILLWIFFYVFFCNFNGHFLNFAKATTSIYCTQYINGRSNFKWTTLKTGAVFFFVIWWNIGKRISFDSYGFQLRISFDISFNLFAILSIQQSHLCFYIYFFTLHRLGFFLLLNFNFRDFFFDSARWMKNFNNNSTTRYFVIRNIKED